jgi:hypothetical protein
MNLLCEVLRDPAIIRGWGAADWNAWLPLTRSARLLGRCLFLFERSGLLDQVPQRLVDQMRGALAQTRYVQVQALRELRQVKRVLDREGIPVAALKGLAYLAGELPPRDWRNLSDIDLLVPEAEVVRAEHALKANGWVPSGEFDDYDQRYYRDWMHEVPPLIHPQRETEVDLHHNLAPPVSRVRIDAARLWEAMVPAPEHHGLVVQIPGPADLLLHNAVHLFMNDELRGGLRDVVDFRDLFRQFSKEHPGFEQALLARAGQLGCGRPLYYAATVADRLVGLDCSKQFLEQVREWAPPRPVAVLMAALIDEALAPPALGRWQSALAKQLLFIRSHWIRMPPLMLAKHLLRKTFGSRKSAQAAEPDLPG